MDGQVGTWSDAAQGTQALALTWEPPGAPTRSPPRVGASTGDEPDLTERGTQMGLMQRIMMIFKAKANRAVDRAEDPRETLDYSYQKQLELLQKVRKGVADVATSRKRIELQMTQLQQQADKLTEQAQKALSVGREDLAREALTRKSALTGQISDLQANLLQLARRRGQVTRRAKTNRVYLSKNKMTPTTRAKPDESTTQNTRAS